MEKQQLEMEEGRLQDAAATFLAGELETIHAWERKYRKQPPAYWEKNPFFESVRGMGAGPFTVWVGPRETGFYNPLAHGPQVRSHRAARPTRSHFCRNRDGVRASTRRVRRLVGRRA